MNMLNPLFQALLMLVIDSVAGMAKTPTVCVSSPILTVEAGSSVRATINGQPGTRCEATLRFTDPEFLPVHYGFQSVTCLGDLQEAIFSIPSQVPNGDAFLLWKCTGQNSPTCNHLWISGGDNDPVSITFDQLGTIACRVPTATITTLSTITGISTSLTEAVVSTAFEEVVPTATTVKLITVTDASTTLIQSVVSTFFSTLPPSSTSMALTVSNAVASSASTSSTSTSTTPLKTPPTPLTTSLSTSPPSTSPPSTSPPSTSPPSTSPPSTSTSTNSPPTISNSETSTSTSTNSPPTISNSEASTSTSTTSLQWISTSTTSPSATSGSITSTSTITTTTTMGSEAPAFCVPSLTPMCTH